MPDGRQESIVAFVICILRRIYNGFDFTWLDRGC